VVECRGIYDSCSAGWSSITPPFHQRTGNLLIARPLLVSVLWPPVAVAAATTADAAAGSKRPNVLFIAVDDLRPELNCYGASHLHSPNLDKPFFLGVGFQKPHLPFCAPKRYWDLYDADTIRLSPITEWPKGSPAFAHWSFGEVRSYHGTPRSGPVSHDLALRLIHGYYASVSYVDAQIGKVLDALERLGLNKNTIVVLWGDHGWKFSEYSAWSKATNYELDTRTVLLLRYPDMPNGGDRSAALVELLDVYPTLCDLAGLPLPEHLEGKSMRPVVVVAKKAESRMEGLTGRNRREQIAVRIADAVTSVLPVMEKTVDWNPAFSHRMERVALSRRRLRGDSRKHGSGPGRGARVGRTNSGIARLALGGAVNCHALQRDILLRVSEGWSEPPLLPRQRATDGRSHRRQGRGTVDHAHVLQRRLGPPAV